MFFFQRRLSSPLSLSGSLFSESFVAWGADQVGRDLVFVLGVVVIPPVEADGMYPFIARGPGLVAALDENSLLTDDGVLAIPTPDDPAAIEAHATSTAPERGQRKGVEGG